MGRLPADYFRNPRRTLWRDEENRPLLGPVVRIGKNVLGGVVVLLGVIMLVAPGQGVLTILIGAMLINFPGKYRLERWLVRRPGVLRTLNWIRRRRDQQPFAEPPAARP